jgi:uncharacterized protein YyaL (SSP411 family)
MNKLGNESSLYLRQHADNPVDWRPWEESALEDARQQRRPILLSIGYSACHWCHVMAHESFEDDETADLMNRLFVNIKVDREERPDLDRIYQLAHQLMTGRGGGWPLTIFLEPVELVPFFAGTYFPRERRFGMAPFREVLQAIHKWYGEHQDEVREQNGKVSEALRSIHNPAGHPGESLEPEDAQRVLQKSAQQIQARHDKVNGGYGGAPKFPQAPLLNAVAGLGSVESADSLHRGLEFTLEKMAQSGLRDHLDGGFFRYCVDEHWVIPHFEKMLYDNAMLLPVYAEGARRWDNAALASTARGIADWLVTVMQQQSGGYAASIDADAGGEEGGFHVWTQKEVDALLEEPARGMFKSAYGMHEAPNFEGQAWHLIERKTVAALAAEQGCSEDDVAGQLENSRKILRRARPGMPYWQRVLCAQAVPWSARTGSTGRMKYSVSFARNCGSTGVLKQCTTPDRRGSRRTWMTIPGCLTPCCSIFNPAGTGTGSTSPSRLQTSYCSASKTPKAVASFSVTPLSMFPLPAPWFSRMTRHPRETPSRSGR